MTARATDEAHRVSSPLELLFDLTFVVAVGKLAAELAAHLESGTAVAYLAPYVMVFFAIWWAWMNFTWFASAYDTDDVPYRILTLVQMAGVLVLAAGVPAAFAGNDYLLITIGYLVMRIGLVAQWVRAAVEHPEGRPTAVRYAVGISVVQLAWAIRAFLLPVSWGAWTFIVLAVAELCVPFLAERTGRTNWHAHHVAERYGLFTIIVLGESVLAISNGVATGLGHGVSWPLVIVALAGLVILFALWWLYYLEPAGEALENNRARSYLWGYSHYAVFVALAALGAGLEAAVASAGGHSELEPTAAGFAIGIPVAVFLIVLWAAHAPIVERPVVRADVVIPAAVVVLLLPLVAPGVGVAGVAALIALACVAVIAVTVLVKLRRTRIRLAP
ncbi:low temperature requirement protein A [Galbitalea soli]|uniref:Low temperature requirement protein A n=2 Tax=Galbitalea soli TaxID=1268042 RepID=A0A7C9TS84_9MICO|nr:low temperature requirement protein A [Galbitalea soli]NEM92498.1 low temperature requirement protein A [Galbitalea soli]